VWGAAEGMSLKVCEPGDRAEVVPLGKVGELHVSSPGVVDGYVGLEDGERFYVMRRGGSGIIRGIRPSLMKRGGFR